MLEKSKILAILDNIAPLTLAEPWDNCGLLVDAVDTYLNIMVCLDVTVEVVNEAVAKGCNLIVSHHPPIFDKLSRISQDDIAFKAIQQGISLYAAHTNMDKAPEGLNQVLAEMIGLNDINGLGTETIDSYVKIVVFCPITDEQKIGEALSAVDAGHIGNYKDYAFSTSGTGRFYPLLDTNPTIGKPGMLETVEEVRIETIIEKEKASKAINRIKASHSYEEPVIDIYPLEYPCDNAALGRIGKLKNKTTVSDLIKTITSAIHPAGLKVTGRMDQMVETVAVSCGAGADLIFEAASQGADVFITGEIKHHHYLAAKQAGIILIEAGHYDTEKQFVKIMHSRLQDALNGLKSNVTVYVSETEQCPYIAVL